MTARDDDELWVVNSLSDSVSVVSLAAGRVVRTLSVVDESTCGHEVLLTPATPNAGKPNRPKTRPARKSASARPVPAGAKWVVALVDGERDLAPVTGRVARPLAFTGAVRAE